MLNQIVLVGRLTKKPEVRELEDGTKVSNITIAVPRSYKNANGEYETDFINCSVWNNIAENVAEYCECGDMLGVKGRIQTRQIETENKKETRQEIVAEKISFLTSRAKENERDID